MSIFDSIISIQENKLRSHRIAIAFKIKPHQNIDETFKKHQYVGYLNFIKSIKDIDDLNYISKDYSVAIKEFEKIKGRLEKIEELGNCKETSKYYNGIKKKYIDKGITSKDIQLTIEWFKTEISKAIQEKRKELKSN